MVCVLHRLVLTELKEGVKETDKIKAFPVADPKITVKILDLMQQAMFYKQVSRGHLQVKFESLKKGRMK